MYVLTNLLVVYNLTQLFEQNKKVLVLMNISGKELTHCLKHFKPVFKAVLVFQNVLPSSLIKAANKGIEFIIDPN